MRILCPFMQSDALFKSCSSTVPLTGGAWSPTRPGKCIYLYHALPGKKNNISPILSPALVGKNFCLVIFVVSCVIDCIEGMTTFTTLMKATEYSVIQKINMNMQLGFVKLGEKFWLYYIILLCSFILIFC